MMSCFPFSQTEKRECESAKGIFWWMGSFSSRSNPERRKSRSEMSSQRISQTISEPCLEPGFDSPGMNVSQNSSQRPHNLRNFTNAELRAATRNFYQGNLLGEGGFGCVYKGWVKHVQPDGEEVKMEVAVKQLNRKGQQGHKEWLAEVHFLGLVEHPNLVKLVGYCAEDDERGIQRLLVYEFMPNKSLEEHLFRRGPPVLPWNERLNIAFGAAQGLAYLHEEIIDVQVIFRDFKTSNVLLDTNFNSKLSDFGLARQGPAAGMSHVSTAVVGTLGYTAPEYLQTGHVTVKSDVWSFGVVLLEMLSGRRSIDRNFPKSEQRLVDWVKPYLRDIKKFPTIMDPSLEGQYPLMQAQKVGFLAFKCLGRNPRARPRMSNVVEKLKQIIDMPDLGIPQSGITSPPAIIQKTDVWNEEDAKELTAKRRLLAFREMMNTKIREDARAIWRVWSPKQIKA
eukprot:c26602_g1_i1 orf=373-1725(+)